MDEKIQTNQLQRIVAMLFALADLADRAGRASQPVRYFVLWLLRPAEAAAREFILAPAGSAEFSPAQLSTVRPGNDPLHASHLAASFRALALVLVNLPTQTRRLFLRWRGREAAGANDNTRCARPGRRRDAGVYCPLPLLDVTATRRLDTS